MQNISEIVAKKSVACVTDKFLDGFKIKNKDLRNSYKKDEAISKADSMKLGLFKMFHKMKEEHEMVNAKTLVLKKIATTFKKTVRSSPASELEIPNVQKAQTQMVSDKPFSPLFKIKFDSKLIAEEA